MELDRHGPEFQRTWAKIVALSWVDPAFRARLIAQPAIVLREYGVEVADDAALALDRPPLSDILSERLALIDIAQAAGAATPPHGAEAASTAQLASAATVVTTHASLLTHPTYGTHVTHPTYGTHATQPTAITVATQPTQSSTFAQQAAAPAHALLTHSPYTQPSLTYPPYTMPPHTIPPTCLCASPGPAASTAPTSQAALSTPIGQATPGLCLHTCNSGSFSPDPGVCNCSASVQTGSNGSYLATRPCNNACVSGQTCNGSAVASVPACSQIVQSAATVRPGHAASVACEACNQICVAAGCFGNCGIFCSSN